MNQNNTGPYIIEIFSSIQGEGSMLGQPTTFIRLGGCNLACPWCDTKESWGHSGGTRMTTTEIIGICKAANIDMVTITGGEPCVSPFLPQLVRELRQNDFIVCLETNATMPTPEDVDWVVASPKPPHYVIHPRCRFDELKYVVTEELDFDKHIITLLNTGLIVPVWLQPDGFDMQTSAMRAYTFIMAEGNKHAGILRLGVQMHKIFNLK